ncbi:SH3 domain-containing protein [Chamaesiphon sp. OTE_8_metabat_110]|uniref:SH3 domain-containing protein n=1 Tax=Chamaesiphon sp. OTE_8_metabat_110 TaxID=2964696 RepID=UPI00286CC490|nr:SH3 domain-containing protein [Chamaesiphon sp. OTE_8_metabat_110]
MNVALKSLQLILGMLTGLVGIIGVLGGAGYYFFVTQMSTRPPKPVFAEERDGGKSLAAKPKAKTGAKPAPAPVKNPQNPDAAGKPPPEAFDAKVVWKDGLSLKKDPDSGAEKVGSVAFNGKVAIVKTSDDKQWVLIRSQVDNAEGWVKAGNIDKAAAAANEVQAAPKPATPVRTRNIRRVRSQ